MTAKQTTHAIEGLENGATNASGKKRAMSETTSPASFKMPPRRLFCPNSMATVPSMAAKAVRATSQAGSIANIAEWAARRQMNAPTSTEPTRDVSVT
jgi:hypothetical protein